MNLKPNKHKRISFDTTTMASVGFIGPPLNLAPPPPPKFNFLLRSPPQLFWSEIFRSPPKIRGGGEAATMLRHATLVKKRLWHRFFPENFVKFLRAPFLQNTSGWLLLLLASARQVAIYLLHISLFCSCTHTRHQNNFCCTWISLLRKYNWFC